MDVTIDDTRGSVESNILNHVEVHGVELFDSGEVAIMKTL